MNLIGFDEFPSTSGLKRILLSQNSDEFCDRLRLIIQQKLSGNDTNRLDDEIVAKFD